MTKVKISNITINLDNKRKPLNGEDRSKISIEKKYPYCGANNIMDYVDEYLFDEEIICIAEDGGKWGADETCSYIMNEKCWINNHAHVLKVLDTNCTDIRYLKYWLNHKDLNGIITGAIVKKLTQKALNDIEIDIPSIEEQRNISNKLDTISNLIEYKKNQILKLNELIKSQFVEMFKGCPQTKLCEIANITMGQSPNSESYNDSADGTPFFQGKADYGDKYTIVKHWTNQPSKIAYKGDVLMSVRAPVGPVNIASCDCCIGRGLCSITAKDGLTNNEFLFNALNTIQEEIASKGTGSTFKAITKNDVYNIELPLGSIELQNKFAQIVEQIDKQKFEFENSLKKLEELQASLMQEYFG